MSDYLLDTNVIINCLRGDLPTTTALRNLIGSGALLHSCDITVAETFSGMRESERDVTEKFLDSLRFLTIDETVSRNAGELRHHYGSRGKKLTLADAMIASLALSRNLTLLTDNIKDYPMPELRKERP